MKTAVCLSAIAAGMSISCIFACIVIDGYSTTRAIIELFNMWFTIDFDVSIALCWLLTHKFEQTIRD